jgi:bifunctional DNase/RNase
MVRRLAGFLLVVWLPLALPACGRVELPGRADPGAAEVAVRVESIRVDLDTQSPVLVLQEMDGERQLPIWIGVEEARSIAARLAEEHPPRPNTHDLTKRLLDRLDTALQRVVVTELRAGIYYARLHLLAGDEPVEVDARPSDAIAIGLRTGAPLFVRAALFDETPTFAPEAGRPIDAPAFHRQVPGHTL